MSAEIDTIVGGQWPAKASAADALKRVGEGDVFVAFWMNDEGALSYSKTDLTPAQYATFSTALAVMAQNAMRDCLEED